MHPFTFGAKGGNDGERIQHAIDLVSKMTMGPDGFRGAVLLGRGSFLIHKPLVVSTSGVVVRGSGQGKDGTILRLKARAPMDLFDIRASSNLTRKRNKYETTPYYVREATRQKIADHFVPVGSRIFHVLEPSKFSIGDEVVITMHTNQAWLDEMSNMSQWGWKEREFQFRRKIEDINHDEIVLDAPFVQAIEARYGGASIAKLDYERGTMLHHIGIERLRLESTFSSEEDEKHGWKAIRASQLQNGWIRQVTGLYFAYGLVSLENGCKQVTIEDCAMLDHKSRIMGGRRYSFKSTDSESILFQRCLARNGRHDFVLGKHSIGPGVFADALAVHPHSDIGPHGRYSMGQLFDNVKGGSFSVQNRRDSGSGHGWSGGK